MSEGGLKKEDRVYLPGLNALRFFAAFFVIVAHTEMFKRVYGLPNFSYYSNLINFGGLGVYFFFVLSGFLITYLLIEEKQRFGKISILSFYVRRILRIWPLYYFLMVLGFFVFPYIDFIHVDYQQVYFWEYWNDNFVCFLLMSPNVAMAFMPQAVPHIGQLWSVGVEEQFYVIWPKLFQKIKKRSNLVLILIFGLIVFKFLYVLGIQKGILPATDVILGLKKLFAMTKFECMLIGAYGAYLVRENSSWLKWISNNFVFAVCLILFPFIKLVLPKSLDDGYHIIGALCFLIIIINVSIFKRGERILEGKVLNYLGKISYGLYMYHMVLCTLFVKIFSHCHWDSKLSSWLIYLVILFVSILVSGLSYKFLEKPFLKMKGRFTAVKSG